MTTRMKVIAGFLASIVLVGFGVAIGAKDTMSDEQVREQVKTALVSLMQEDGPLGGSSFYEKFQIWFGSGLFAGDEKQLTVDEDGDLSTSGTLAAATSTTGYLSHGGAYTSISTTSATYTLSVREFKSSVIDIESMPTSAALTLSLPATSTGAYPGVGKSVDFIVKNSHTAAATTTTIAAGTGVDLQEPDGQNVVIGIANYAYITCTTLDTTDTVCRVDETIPAD
jgi:hypothetical protein